MCVDMQYMCAVCMLCVVFVYYYLYGDLISSIVEKYVKILGR